VKLHIYGQAQQHLDAFVIGDLEGLQTLRRAIDVAIGDNHDCQCGCNGKGSDSAFSAVASDGEGYRVFVHPISGDDERWAQLALPYTDPMYTSTGFVEKVIHPVDSIGLKRYADLAQKLRELDP
jgi:hypothetical protein